MAATLRERQRARAKRPDAEPKTCPTCHTEFTSYRPQQVYCSAGCRTRAERMTVNPTRSPRRRGEKPAIVPTAMQPGRARPMQEDELTMYLARETREIEAAGRPTHDPGWRHRRASVRQNER